MYMKNLDLQIEMIENLMYGEEKFMWTTIEFHILIHVVNPNLLGLRIWHCCLWRIKENAMITIRSTLGFCEKVYCFLKILFLTKILIKIKFPIFIGLEALEKDWKNPSWSQGF